MNELDLKQKKLFDDIRHVDENGYEYWLARELQGVLQYAKWENFHKVIKTAQIACKISQQQVSDHFPDLRKMVDIGSGAKRSQIDYKLTRYACYLIVMNGDPRKEVIALGQTYFAVKTRQQELAELYNVLSEDEKRLFIRGDVKQKNMLLAEAAHKAGIITNQEYATFQDAGYRGLYGGMTAGILPSTKGLRKEKRFSIGWAVKSWRQTYSALPKQKPKCAARGRPLPPRRMPRIIKWGERCAKRSPSSAAQCPRSSLRPRRAFGSWKPNSASN